MEKVFNLHKVPEIKGVERHGFSVVVDGHEIPNMHMLDKGDLYTIILDGRLAYDVPKDMSFLFADAIANAMAIGAGFPHYKEPKKDIYATEVREL